MNKFQSITTTPAKRPLHALAALVLLSSAAHAGVLIDPVSVSTTMGEDINSLANNVRNQSALTPAYISGVTDLNTYLNANPLHDGVTLAGSPPVGTTTNVWLSTIGNTTGNFEFDLGGSMSIDAFLFWNIGSLNGILDPKNVQNFTLPAADNPSFADPTTIGNFTSNPTSDAASVRVEVFPFSAVVTASYIRMEITSNYGDTDVTGFCQAAFDATPPEPATASLLLLAAPTILLRHRQKIS